MPAPRFDAVVFDKDGTLVAFHPTWDMAFGEMLRILADGDGVALAGAASAAGYDLATQTVPDTSPIIAESSATLSAMMAPALGRVADEAFVGEVDHLLGMLSLEHVTPSAGAGDALAALAAAGVRMAVATNDAEGTARLQIERLGWTEYFDFVAGHDSGHGSKPEPTMVLACAEAITTDPSRVAMVGDTRHDLEAARRAGVASILVGGLPELARSADYPIADLGALPSVVLGADGS